MRTWWLILMLGLTKFTLGQGKITKIVTFAPQAASITLVQLDSIQAFAELAKKQAIGKILIDVYAEDARRDAQGLSWQRAVLLRQCLERTGIAPGDIRLRAAIRRKKVTDACGHCAEISITANENEFFQNRFLGQIREQLQYAQRTKKEVFWIKPGVTQHFFSKAGIFIGVPAKLTNTTDSSLIRLEVYTGNSSIACFKNGLGNTTVADQSLSTDFLMQFELTQNGKELKVEAPIAFVLPEQMADTTVKLFHAVEQLWEPVEEKKWEGYFFSSTRSLCTSGATAAVERPDLGAIPAQPNYENEATKTTAIQQTIKEETQRLDYLKEELGKVKKRKQRQALELRIKKLERNLKSSRLKEDRKKRAIRQRNEQKQTAYHIAMGQYYKNKSKLQQNYWTAINKNKSQTSQGQALCEKDKLERRSILQSYGPEAQEWLNVLAQKPTEFKELARWIQVDHNGWYQLAQIHSGFKGALVPYRVETKTSSYRMLAYLNIGNDFVEGELLDESSFVFWAVPEGEQAQLILFAVGEDETVQQVITKVKIGAQAASGLKFKPFEAASLDKM